MRTFLRVSLLGNAFIDLACILFLLHSSGNHRPDAAFSSEAVEKQAAVDSNEPIGVFAGAAPFLPSELPEYRPAVFLGGDPMPAELAQFAETPKYTTAYEMDWRFEGKPLDTRLGRGAYPRPSP